jgi:hypothetical protein
MVILGAAIGGVAASRTARDLIRQFPKHAGAWVRAQRDKLLQRWRRFKRRLIDLYRQARIRLLDDWEKLLHRLGLTKRVTIRARAAGAIAISGSATVTVSRGPIERRVENLEKWRDETIQDDRIEARLLIIGFTLIGSGELVNLVFC